MHQHNEIPSGRETKRCRLRDAFLLTRDGRPKSTLLLYSFSMSILLMALYGAAFMLMLDGLDSHFSARLGWGNFAVNLMESVIPSAAATAVCVLISLVIRDKRIVPFAFTFMAVYALALFAYLLLTAFEDAAIFAPMFLWFALVPLALGGTAVYFAAYRSLMKKTGGK